MAFGCVSTWPQRKVMDSSKMTTEIPLLFGIKSRRKYNEKLRPMFGQRRGQVFDLVAGEELQPHDLQPAVHPQLVDPLPVRAVGRDDLPFELFAGSLPNPLRWAAL